MSTLSGVASRPGVLDAPYVAQLGATLRTLRERAGLSQRDVGGRVRLSCSSLCRFERGDRRPSHATLRALAYVYAPAVDGDVEALLDHFLDVAGPTAGGSQKGSSHKHGQAVR